GSWSVRDPARSIVAHWVAGYYQRFLILCLGWFCLGITIGGAMRQRDELELLRWRISFVGYVIVAALLVLAFGFWNAQIVQSGYYQQRAEQNRIREIPLPAPRGRIYDRYHRILADNRPSYNIILIRESSPHTVEQTAAIVSAGISMSKDDLMDRINRKRR